MRYVNHPKWSFAVALFLCSILTVGVIGGASAGDIEVGYLDADDEPIGIWPRYASANSKRYFRAVVEYDPGDEYIYSLTAYGGGMYKDIVTPGLPSWEQPGTDEGVAWSWDSTLEARVYTIGPYAGYDIWGRPHGGVIGNLWTSGVDVPLADQTVRFRVVFADVEDGDLSDPETATTASFNTYHDNSDYLQWYSGDATGVDPISVSPEQISPDDGTGSSRFRFKVVYRNRYGLPPLVCRTTYPPPSSTDNPGARYYYVDYDPENPLNPWFLRYDWWDDFWLYSNWDDHGFDRVADERQYHSGEVILIIDGDRTRPHFMHREDPANENWSGGVTFFYDLLPTDYKRYLDNIFLFPYNPAGPDELDRYLNYLLGRPNSNNYVALSAGGHTYEFIVTDDFSPAMDQGWMQVGQPGNGLHNDYLRTRPRWRGITGRDPGTDVDDFIATRENTRFLDSDYAAGGSGYPYDSQNPDRYPKVDPVLSAHPYFPTGTISPNAIFSPDPTGAAPSPFPVDTAGGPVPALRYTNDDTILPNYVNIHPETAATPFKGGKWTNQTTFTFRINYWQSEDIAPDFIRAFIRRNDHGLNPTGPFTGYTMEQMSPADRVYRDGCVFQFQATPEQLPGGGGPGDYNYYFAASDGTRTTIYPSRPDVYAQPGAWDIYDQGQYGVPQTDTGEDYYWFRVNRPPALSGESVTPASGRSGQNFQFRVDYTDVDGELLQEFTRGDRPFHARIHLDLFGSRHGQASVIAVDSSISLTYQTSTGNLYDDGELVGMELTMESGAADDNTYPIVANIGNVITLAAGSDLLGDGVAIGDRFRISKWFVGTMSREDSTDDDYADGAQFIFDTATNVELGPGVHHYYFEFWDDWGSWLYPDDPNVKVEGEPVRYPNSDVFEGPEVRENTAPQLIDFHFTPKSVAGGPDGTTATGFVFFVTYVDQENDPPALIRLGIDGTPQAPDIVLDLVPDPPEDDVYTDGAIYRTLAVKLSEGDHIFYAQASDGKARFPNTPPDQPLIFSGPYDETTGGYEVSVEGPTVAPNTPPTLTFLPEDDGSDPDNPPGLDPNTGDRTTNFTYTVVYTDTDRFAGIAGNPPKYVQVYIDDRPFDMTAADPNDYDYTDGATFQLANQQLIEGTPHTYFFVASDDLDRARLPATGVVPRRYNGPVVDEPPGAPMNLLVQDTPNDNGSSMDLEFSASPDDAGGARDVTEYRVYRTEIRGQYGVEPLLTAPATGQAAYHIQDKAPDSSDPPVDGTEYYYIVKAFDAAAESARSNEEGPVTSRDNIPPRPPSGLSISNPALGGTLDLAWTLSPDDGAGYDDVTEYHIYRSVDPAVFAPPWVGTAAAGESTFRDTTVPDEVDVYYIIRAFDGSNESAPSQVAGPKQSTDEEAPVLSNLQPADGATGVPRDTTISFLVEDSGAGVDIPSIQVDVTVLGEAIEGNLQTEGTPAAITVTFTPYEAFDYLQNVRVSVYVEDQQGNPRSAPPWTFIIEGEPTSTISGQVLQNDDTPIGNVRVIAGEIEAKTDFAGNFTIEGLAEDTHEVHAQLRGWYFTPTHVAITVPPDAAGIIFRGQPGFDIEGRVVDEVGAGVPGVLMTTGEKSEVTGANGRFYIMDLPADTYRLRPVLDGHDFVPPHRDVEIGPGHDGGGQLFTAVPESHALSGLIQTSTGERMAGVRVRARNTDTGDVEEVLTSISGQYRFEALRQGTYEVTPALADYQFKPARQSVDLLTQKTDINFVGVPEYEVSLPAGLSFVAVPISPETTDFRMAFGPNTPVARWDAVSNKWITSNNDPTNELLDLAAGRGYWVNPASDISNPVAGTPIPTSVGYDLELTANWTSVGNPYPAVLPWRNIGVAPGGDVKDYGFIYDRDMNGGEGGYRVVADAQGIGILDTVPKGAGFWMYSTTARTVRTNALTAPAAARRPQFTLSEGDYLIPLQAAGAGCADGCAAVGALQAADRLPDGGKFINPPTTGAFVDLYFLGDAGRRLCYDLRTDVQSAQTWNFEVVTNIGDIDISVALPDLSRVPAGKQVTLTDTATGKRIYVRTAQQYTYRATQDAPRRFKLEVSPRTVGALVISSASATMARGGHVAVAYSLSQSAEVTLNVMNISGRSVKALAAAAPAAAGVNSQLWDLSSSRGTQVPNGTYLISIRATTDTGQQTRTVVPVQVSR